MEFLVLLIVTLYLLNLINQAEEAVKRRKD